MDEYGLMLGYKLNMSETQVLTFNYKTNKEIRRRYNLNWNAQSIKYLGVIVTQEFDRINETDYKLINSKIRKCDKMVNTSNGFQLKVVKMNLLPRLLYLFVSLPVRVSDSQFSA